MKDLTKDKKEGLTAEEIERLRKLLELKKKAEEQRKLFKKGRVKKEE